MLSANLHWHEGGMVAVGVGLFRILDFDGPKLRKRHEDLFGEGNRVLSRSLVGLQGVLKICRIQSADYRCHFDWVEKVTSETKTT